MPWLSRKLWLTVLVIVLVFTAWVVCGRPQSLFGALCTALIAAAGIYKGSNAVDQLLAKKTPPA